MFCPELKTGETIEDLQRRGYRIIQNSNSFKFGTDSVLMSEFVTIKPRSEIADFGAGNGIISLLIAARHADVRIHALEIQPDIAEMFERSVLLNALGEHIHVINGDIRGAYRLLGASSMDCVVCNPPYYDMSDGMVSGNKSKAIARTNIAITLNEICLSANRVLKSRGRFALVYPAFKLDCLMKALDAHSFALKRCRTVHATCMHAPKLILAEAIKDGGSGIDWLPPLVIKNTDGSYTDEYDRIYYG